MSSFEVATFSGLTYLIFGVVFAEVQQNLLEFSTPTSLLIEACLLLIIYS